MFSRKKCFTTATHLINHKVSEVWAAMHKIYQMYMLRRFHIVEIAGDGEFSWIADQVASLPTMPILNLAAASKHVGLVEQKTRFLKEKTCSICHSLPFKHIPALMLVRMVLYTVQFMNSFPHKGGLKHYPPSTSDLSLGAIAKLRRMLLLAIALLPIRMGQSLWDHLGICLEGNAFSLWILAS